MIFSSGAQSHIFPTSPTQTLTDQPPPASPLSFFSSLKKRARAASNASRSRASSSARTRSRTASPELSSVPPSPATSEEDLGLLDQDPFASYGCKSQPDLPLWSSAPSTSLSPNNEIFDFNWAINNPFGAYDISKRDEPTKESRDYPEWDQRRDSTVTVTEDEPDILPLHRRGRSLTTTVIHPRNQPWPSDRPAFRSRPSLPSLSVLTHQNIIVHAPRSSRARQFPVEPWDREEKPLPVTPTTSENDDSAEEVQEQGQLKISIDEAPELPREAPSSHVPLPPCPSPIQEESEEEIQLAGEYHESTELPYLENELTIRYEPPRSMSLLINPAQNKHPLTQHSSDRNTLTTSLRIEVELVHQSHEDSLSMPSSYPPRHVPASPTPSSCLLPSPRPSSRSSISDRDYSGSEFELDSPGKVTTAWWNLSSPTSGPRTPPTSPRSPSPDLNYALARAGLIENLRIEPTLTTVAAGVKRAHSFPQRSPSHATNFPAMSRSASYSGRGDRQPGHSGSRQEGRSSTERQSGQNRGHRSGDTNGGFTNGFGPGGRDDDDRRWNGRHSQRSFSEAEHVAYDSEDSESNYAGSDRSQRDSNQRLAGNLQIPGSTTSSRRGSRTSPIVPPVPPLPPHISNNNFQNASSARSPPQSRTSQQQPIQRVATATTSPAESDDDVPLAQAIPSALTAQKSIRKLARDERDARSRRPREPVRKPTGLGLPTSENSAALADQLTSKLLKVQEQTTTLDQVPSGGRVRSQSQSQRSRSRAASPHHPSESPAAIFPGELLSPTAQHFGKYPIPPHQSQTTFPPMDQPKGVRPSRSLHRLHTESSAPSNAFDQPVPRRRQQSVGPRNERPPIANVIIPPLPRRSTTQSRKSSPDRSPFPKSPRLIPNGNGEDSYMRGTELAPPVPYGSGSRRPSHERMDRANTVTRKSEDNLRRGRSTRDGREDYPQLPPSPMPSNLATPLTPRLPSASQQETSHQQRVFVGDLQRFVTVEINSTTRAGDVVDTVAGQGEISGEGWMLWEMANEFGMERPIRNYERLSTVFTSWNPEARLNALMLKQTPLAFTLSQNNIPSSSPTFGGYVNWEVKRGKWTKKWLELREHSLFLGKKENSKDEAFLCSLSSFDGYFLKRIYRAPKAFVFAVKSTDNVSIFENPSDCAHIFSCDAEGGNSWIEKILIARSYVLHQEHNVLVKSHHTFAGEGATMSRSTTRKTTRPYVADPNVMPVLPPLAFQSSPGLFSEGSLLAKESTIA